MLYTSKKWNKRHQNLSINQNQPLLSIGKNNNKESHQSGYKLSQEKYSKVKYLRGLPNIGLTCYLNSVLQFLFSAQLFREQLIHFSEKQKKTGVASIIGAIFVSLKKNQPFGYLSHMLMQLTNILQLPLGVEDDSLKVLNEILSRVKEEVQGIDSLFNVRTQIHCKCLEESLILDSDFMSTRSQLCIGCQEQLSKTIINQPKYLMYTGQVQDYEERKQINGVNYRLSSQILYSGSMESGHYMCMRVENGEKYLFNDHLVFPIEQTPKNKFSSKCILYQQQGFMTNECLEQVNKENSSEQEVSEDGIQLQLKQPDGIINRVLKPFKDFRRRNQTETSISLIYFLILGSIIGFLFSLSSHPDQLIYNNKKQNNGSKLQSTPKLRKDSRKR